MPGKHKSPLYKGISKNYKQMPKGQRGFKMESPLLKNTDPDFSNPKVVETYLTNKKYRDYLKDERGITYNPKTKKSEKVLKNYKKGYYGA